MAVPGCAYISFSFGTFSLHQTSDLVNSTGFNQSAGRSGRTFIMPAHAMQLIESSYCRSSQPRRSGDVAPKAGTKVTETGKNLICKNLISKSTYRRFVVALSTRTRQP